MFVNLKYIKFKNILSYGNQFSEFSFQTGLNLISAKNGHGKSTVLEALTFNLFGKPYRKIKLAELVNRRNKKGLITESEFEIDDNRYKIIRGLGPAKLEILKNDSPLESLSSKALVQDEINKILGLDYNIFKLIIALSVNYNKPFLALELGDKREVMESIFNIKIFGEMLSKLKKRIVSIKNDKLVTETTMKNMESTISSLRKQIIEIENSIKSFDKNKEDEIAELTTEIESLRTQIIEIEEQNLDILEKKKLLDIPEKNDYNKTILDLSANIKADDLKLKDLDKQIKFLEKVDECPLCGTVMTPDHKEQEIKKITKEKSKLLAKKTQKEEKLVLANKELSEYESKVKQLTEFTSTQKQLSSKKESALHDIAQLEKSMDKIQNRKFDFDATSIREEFEIQKNEYISLSKRLNDITEKLKVHDYSQKMLSEDGIKSYFFKRLLPILNGKINEYLELFELPITIQFNDVMEENISINLTPEKNISYMAFSEGEKKRIDIAILLSFIDVTKIITNWNCNVILFDEVLDNATDAEGLEKLLSAIKNMTVANTNLCSYVISHRDSDSEFYDRKISIKKVGGFSKIK